jgi:hypothetical protein
MTGTSGKAQQSAARRERLSAALRENLKRRKAQARGRAQERGDGDSETAGSAGTGGEPGTPDFRRNHGRE